MGYPYIKLNTWNNRYYIIDFEDSFSTDTEAFTGGLTEANPPLFVDLLKPSAGISSFAAASAHIQKCRNSCDEIRKKTCAMSVVCGEDRL